MEIVYSVPYSELVHKTLWKKSKGDVDRFAEFLKIYVYDKLRDEYSVDIDEIWDRSEIDDQLKFEIVPEILYSVEEYGKVPKTISLVLRFKKEEKKNTMKKKPIQEVESNWRETIQALLDIISSSTSAIEDSVKDYFEIDDEEIRDAIRSKIMSALEVLQVAVDELSNRFGFIPSMEDEEEEVEKENEEEGSEEGNDFINDTLEQENSEKEEQNVE